MPHPGWARRIRGTLAALEDASPEEVAVVQLYEATHRGRKTVLAAAERRLNALSPPRA